MLSILEVNDLGFVIDYPAGEKAAAVERAIEMLVRLDAISPERFHLWMESDENSDLGRIVTGHRDLFVRHLTNTITFEHRYVPFAMAIEPGVHAYTITHLDQDHTGFAVGVEESRRAGQRLWEIWRELEGA